MSLDYDPHFSDAGRVHAWNELVEVLSARAYGEQSLAQHPAAAEVEIRRPLVILGVPRTGTTALHKLMAVDPQFQGLQRWITTAPMPRPPRGLWRENRHFAQSEARLEAVHRVNPNMRAAHHVVAEDVDECLEILKQSFVSNRCWA